eukprot:7092228-Pyramimonas_sp.AAC.1
MLGRTRSVAWAEKTDVLSTTNSASTASLAFSLGLQISSAEAGPRTDSWSGGGCRLQAVSCAAGCAPSLAA